MSNAYDYKVYIKVKNGRICRLMEEQGIHSQSQLAQISGVSACEIGKIINFKVSPVRKQDGKFTVSVNKLAHAFGVDPMDLFSTEQLQMVVASNQREVYVSHEQALKLADATPYYAAPSLEVVHNNLMTRKTIQSVLDKLTSKQRQIVSLRYGLCGTRGSHTLDETGDIVGLSRERVRQIEAQTFRRLRLPRFGLAALVGAV